MPYGLPSATVCQRSGDVAKFDPVTFESRGGMMLLYGQHLTILHAGADQDGFNGEIVCMIPNKLDFVLAVPRSQLRLS